MEFLDYYEPMYRMDSRGRMKVKIIEMDQEQKKIVIHKSILIPYYPGKLDLDTRLKMSIWNEVTIQYEDEEETKKRTIFILHKEISKGYTVIDFLIGHQSLNLKLI
jgi:hypothetical protein